MYEHRLKELRKTTYIKEQNKLANEYEIYKTTLN